MKYQNSSKALLQLRQKIFNYPPTIADKADRVLCYLKERKMRDNKNQSKTTGPYSGLTRRELKHTGTCEPDWF